MPVKEGEDFEYVENDNRVSAPALPQLTLDEAKKLAKSREDLINMLAQAKESASIKVISDQTGTGSPNRYIVSGDSSTVIGVDPDTGKVITTASTSAASDYKYAEIVKAFEELGIKYIRYNYYGQHEGGNAELAHISERKLKAFYDYRLKSGVRLDETLLGIIYNHVLPAHWDSKLGSEGTVELYVSSDKKLMAKIHHGQRVLITEWQDSLKTL